VAVGTDDCVRGFNAGESGGAGEVAAAGKGVSGGGSDLRTADGGHFSLRIAAGVHRSGANCDRNRHDAKERVHGCCVIC